MLGITFLLMQSWMKVFWSRTSPQYFSLVRMLLIWEPIHSTFPETVGILWPSRATLISRMLSPAK